MTPSNRIENRTFWKQTKAPASIQKITNIDIKINCQTSTSDSNSLTGKCGSPAPASV